MEVEKVMEISVTAIVLATVCSLGSIFLALIYGIRLGNRATLISFSKEIETINMLREILNERLIEVDMLRTKIRNTESKDGDERQVG